MHLLALSLTSNLRFGNLCDMDSTAPQSNSSSLRICNVHLASPDDKVYEPDQQLYSVLCVNGRVTSIKTFASIEEQDSVDKTIDAKSGMVIPPYVILHTC